MARLRARRRGFARPRNAVTTFISPDRAPEPYAPAAQAFVSAGSAARSGGAAGPAGL
jgi:hypothetical protein